MNVPISSLRFADRHARRVLSALGLPDEKFAPVIRVLQDIFDYEATRGATPSLDDRAPVIETPATKGAP